jgi:SAM-dependent methyltransferase
VPTTPTVPAGDQSFEHFDALYSSQSDPWGYKSVWHEQRRFAILAAMLDRRAYKRAFEPGCSNGTLTVELLSRCGQVLALDGSENAVSLARQATNQFENVEVKKGAVPNDWPSGKFDLIVLSDFLYYLSPSDIVEVAQRSLAAIAKPGTILAGHWKGSAHDFVTPGGLAVHAILVEVLGAPSGGTYEDSDQIISTWIS